MRVVLQRVKEASVSIDGQLHGKIGKGFILLVGVSDTDGEAEVDYLTHKISKLRVFEDEAGKLNLDINAVNGAILSISQFTLYADTKKGNRPSFKGLISLENQLVDFIVQISRFLTLLIGVFVFFSFLHHLLNLII